MLWGWICSFPSQVLVQLSYAVLLSQERQVAVWKGGKHVEVCGYGVLTFFLQLCQPLAFTVRAELMIAFDNTPVIKGQECFQTIGADISSELIFEIVFKLERQFTFKTNVPVARVKPQDHLKLYRRLSLLMCWGSACSNPQQEECTPWVSSLAGMKCWTNSLISESENVALAVVIIGAKCYYCIKADMLTEWQ